jgi:hypothetical protein
VDFSRGAFLFEYHGFSRGYVDGAITDVAQTFRDAGGQIHRKYFILRADSFHRTPFWAEQGIRRQGGIENAQGILAWDSKRFCVLSHASWIAHVDSAQSVSP